MMQGSCRPTVCGSPLISEDEQPVSIKIASEAKIAVSLFVVRLVVVSIFIVSLYTSSSMIPRTSARPNSTPTVINKKSPVINKA
jgi:hypothetical protein